MVKPVPEGYHAVTPYLIVSDAGKAIEFYKRGLGAQEIMRMPGPGGRIMHAEVKIGDSIVMLGEEPPDKPTLRAPQAAGLQTASLYLYVPNVDTAFKRALDAGAKAVQPVTDMFWGDRIAQIADPSGHQWTLATHKEDLTPEEIGRSPFDRVNTGDNTPAVIHVDIVPGATLGIMVMAKGGGCENRSKYKMLTPAEGLAGVKEWIIECVKTAGPDACPPLILGVGIGGTFEKAAILSKKALFRELGSPNPDPQLDALEKELLDRANRLGIGPQGYGGDTTAFGVHILTYPCHITSLPVAVTIECHAHRHKDVTL